MSKITGRFLFLMALFLAWSVVNADNIYIENGQVGNVKVGMSVDCLIAKYPDKVDMVRVLPHFHGHFG